MTGPGTKPLGSVPDWADLAAVLDLAPAPTLADQVRALQERRAEQLAAVEQMYPLQGPTATLLAIRAGRYAEIKACEDALRAVGAPFAIPADEDERE